MKKLTCVLVILSFFLFIGNAVAEDMILKTKITSATESVDKNGNSYMRFIVDEQRTLQGVQYTVGVPVMAFATTYEKAKDLKAGDTLNAIVKKREWQSRESYTILSFLN